MCALPDFCVCSKSKSLVDGGDREELYEGGDIVEYGNAAKMTTLRPRKKDYLMRKRRRKSQSCHTESLGLRPQLHPQKPHHPLVASPKARSGPFQRCLGLVANLGDTDQLGGRQIAADDASTSHDLCLPQGKEPAQAANPAISPQLTARNTILASVSIPVTVGI
ncbi:hypothetical protein HBI82_233670 [Parastagonospora nodorum]|nr:hypothetical protein HBI13_231100 [Parastagonospora nodorum]KAH4112169.1 hypothetical protein HBH47_230230 [Parastagonospora nodorum]KAH5046378.1 hypothetical protein HBH96_231800 [Parastagonospora nodorum]KAH5059230.1 hypothetical protein HBH95_239920 [Parastagonospora nodorum]KAH5237597.1 hypothetical protein HBI72_234800 [Parastagonospora nodorum]